MSNFDWLYHALAAVGFVDPVHPAIVHMPIGLVAGALFFGFAALIWQRPLLGLSARHCLVLAWLFVIPAVLFGYIDWQHFYHGVWLTPIKIKVGLATFLFVVLSVGLVMIYKGRGESKGILVIYVLAFITVVGLGYFGGRLVFGGQSPAAPKGLKAGKKIFDARCRACHAHGGNLIMPQMPLRGSDKLGNYQTFLAFIRDPRLDNGHKGPMPAWPPAKISDKEARSLYDYVKQAFGDGQPPGKAP
jgi:mono/diheme cytochrome c family protein